MCKIADPVVRETLKDGNAWMMRAARRPPIREAAKYFHTAAMTGLIPIPIGLPAYQKAGRERIQKDTVQAAAIPTGPNRRARRNKLHVTAASTIPQRNQRSGLPMER